MLNLVLVPGFSCVLQHRVRDGVEVVVDSFQLKDQAGHFTLAQSLEVDDGGFGNVGVHDCCWLLLSGLLLSSLLGLINLRIVECYLYS